MEPMQPSRGGECAAPMLCILDVLASNIGTKTAILLEVYRGFPQSLEANAGTVP
jgi:hypothetical protein